MATYEVKIKEASRELTAREKIKISNTTDCVKLDEATSDEALVITPVGYAILSIHNEKADDVDYEQYVVEDKDGQTYVTGSTTFWNSFINIFETMKEEDEEYSIKVFRMPSKNFAGRDFITCAII